MTPEADSRVRARRLALCALIAGFFVTLGGLSGALIPFERYWGRAGFKALPAPSEIVAEVAQTVRSPGGVVLMLAIMSACVTAVLRGRCDAESRKVMIVTVVLIIVVIAAFVAAIYLPTIRLHGPNVPLID